MSRYDGNRGRGPEMKGRHYEVPPYIRQDIPLRSDQAMKIHKKLTESFLNGQGVFDYWRLSQVETLENEAFEMEYSQIRNDFLSKGFKPSEVSTNWGFLATTSEKMIDLSLHDGLCVKFSPINTLGYCISGVHLSTHADVCLLDAAYELGGDVKDLILVAFKFMFGQWKAVTPTYGAQVALTAPTPGFNSHISDVHALKGDQLSIQHKRSFVYIYEFENDFFHPRERPRHCCPVAALHFKRVKPLPPQGLEMIMPPQPVSIPAGVPPPVPPVIPGISAAVQSAVNLVTNDPGLRKVLETVKASAEKGPAVPTSISLEAADISTYVRDLYANDYSAPANAREQLQRDIDSKRRVKCGIDSNPVVTIPGIHSRNPGDVKPAVEHPMARRAPLIGERPVKPLMQNWNMPPKVEEAAQTRLGQYRRNQFGNQFEPQGFDRPQQHQFKNQPNNALPMRSMPMEAEPKFLLKAPVRKNPFAKSNSGQQWRQDNQGFQGDSRSVKIKDRNFPNSRLSEEFDESEEAWNEEYDPNDVLEAGSEEKPWSDQPPPVLRNTHQDQSFQVQEDGMGRKRSLLGSLEGQGGFHRGNKQPRNMINPFVQRQGSSQQDVKKLKEPFKYPGAPASTLLRRGGRGARSGAFRGKPNSPY